MYCMRNSHLDLAVVLIFIFLGMTSLQAQHYNRPIDGFSKLFLLRSDTNHFGSFQGLPEDWYSMEEVKGIEEREAYSVAGAKLFNEHLIQIEAEDLRANIDLLLNFEVGQEQKFNNAYHDTTLLSRNMRGFIIRGDIGEKVSFETSFREHQSVVPWYLYQYTLETGVMPGAGRVKAYNATGRDHNTADGYIAYAPSDWVNIQFGTQKNFIGSGYRSLLLSDHSYSYPQLKTSFRFLDGRLRYHLIHAWMQTTDRLPRGDTPEALFIRKDGSFKYLEIAPIPEVSIGFFEGVIWRRHEKGVGTRPVDTRALSPLIGTSALSLGLDDLEDNVVLGLDLSARPFHGLSIYGQYVMDRDDRDGFQVGIRTIDLGLNGLSLRGEYNSISAFTYTHRKVQQNYGNFSEAIAHPMGAGFDELSLGLSYFMKRWFIDLRYIGADMLRDDDGPIDDSADEGCTAGGDIFSPLNCNVHSDLSVYETRLDQIDLRVGHFFNPKSNFNAYLGWLFRERTGAGDEQYQSMFTFGIEMSLYNRYEDF